MRPSRHRGPDPRRDNRAVAVARRGLHRFAWQIGGRGASPPLPLPLRGIAVACSFPTEISGWRFVHEPVDTQSGRARNGGRARAGARCHREGTLALSRTCSVCRYCAHAAVECRPECGAWPVLAAGSLAALGQTLVRQTPAHVRCCCSTTMEARCGTAGKSHTGGAGIRRNTCSREPPPLRALKPCGAVSSNIIL